MAFEYELGANGAASPAKDGEQPDPRLDTRYERWDEMSDEYRAAAARIASFQSLAEVVGVLPFIEWVEGAPDYARKQMLIAKIQDEVGHGHVMARVAEDLGVTREQILADFVAGRTKLLNIFHYRFESWEAMGPGALLMNSAAIVQFNSLSKGTYLPYVRALKKIEKEEGFHYHHAWDLAHEIMTEGTEEQRRRAQEAFETWLPRLLAYFGPPDSDTFTTNRMYRLGLKVDSNDHIRQRWLARIIPVFQAMGYRVPIELAHYDEDGEIWVYAQPDWAEIKRIISEGGPAYQLYVEHIRGSLERNGPYRTAALARAA
ncbi:MAG: Phenylacetic acid catabolic protein [Actinomycetota bacterium]